MVATDDREVLREMGRLDRDLLLQLPHGVLLAVGEEFEDPDTERMREALEKARLQFVQRSVTMA